MRHLALFCAGALLCNGLPHLFTGVRGEAFPTPFADPPAVGPSPAPVNVAWGSANVLAGLGVVSRLKPTPRTVPDWAALAFGFVAMGLGLSAYFSHVRARGAPRQPASGSSALT